MAEPGTPGSAGWLGRLGSRLGGWFAPRAPGRPAAPGDRPACAARVAAAAEDLFSVFPEAAGEDEAPRSFCLHLAHALAHLEARPEAPRVVGLLGAGGCGKSTLVNLLSGSDACRVDILPHTTQGPVGVTGSDGDLRGLLSPLALREGDEEPSRGELDGFRYRRLPDFPFPGLVLLDLPDLNTRAARAEGTLAASLMPWLDAALLVFSVETFRRQVLDAPLELLGPLGTDLHLVFNRKSDRGPMSAGDPEDLAERARALGARGPFVIPNLRETTPDPDDRGRLCEALSALAGSPRRPARLQGLRRLTVELTRQALDRHARQAGRVEAARRRFRRHLGEARRELELEPMAALADDPNEIPDLLRDLRGLVGSPLELIRRVGRGQGVGAALQSTFSIQARVAELEAAVERLDSVSSEVYVERLRGQFQSVSRGVALAYSQVVEDEPALFIEARCPQDLAEVLYDDRAPAVAHGFESFRDETVNYLGKLRAQLEGGSGKLEGWVALAAFAALMGDLFVPGGGTFAMVGGGYLAVRTVAPELEPVLAAHRRFRARQREGLERAWDLLGRSLEEYFMAGPRYFGRIRVLEGDERAVLESCLETLGRGP